MSIRRLSSIVTPRVTRIDLGDGVVHVLLSRGSKMNALDMPMFEAIQKTAAELSKDKSVRAVILSGEGKSFCAGLDVKSMASSPVAFTEKLLKKPAMTEISNLAQDVGYLWRMIPAPVIACIHGVCLGGGFQIALGCDFRICTPDAQFSIMESKWGLIPDMSGSVTLRELVRIDVAKELTMTGRVFDGLEAKELGLVTRVAEDPMEASIALAKLIAKKSPDSTAMTKRLFQETWTVDDATALDTETRLQTKLLGSWNQVMQSGSNYGVSLPFISRSTEITDAK